MHVVAMTAQRAADTASTQPGAEPWVSVEGVAAYLGVKKLSIYRWIEARGLPARKIGRLWKLKLSHVDAWVQSSGGAAGDSAVPGAPKSTPASGPRAIDLQDAPRQRTILVIDNEQAVRESICDFLTNDGYRVLSARDGVAAREHLAASPRPSLVVLDLEMPTLDGVQFRQQLIRHPAWAAVPVVGVTAASSVELEGISALLRKPLSLPLLAKTIESLVEDPDPPGSP